MSALELLQAEIEIVCREIEGLRWTLDVVEPWDRPPPPDMMTPMRFCMRLTSLVDEYVRDRSLDPRQEKIVRDGIDRAIESAEARLEEHFGRKATKWQKAARPPSAGVSRPR